MNFTKPKREGPPVGLDIDAGSIAATELDAEGARVGVQPLAAGTFGDGEVLDTDALAAALRELFGRLRLTRRVRLAVAGQGVAFRVLRLPLLEDADRLRSAVRFQAQEQIPMPIDSAVLDHQVIGAVVGEEGSRQVDVAVVAARREKVDALVRAARAAGLDPVGIDLAAFAMIRALAGGAAGPAAGDGEGGEFVPATLYCCLGDGTNLAIARRSACLFSRVAQFGMRQVVEELAGATGLAPEVAQQWLLYTGLEVPLDRLEGDAATAAAARAALESGVGRLADELRLSLDYYGSQDGAAPVGGVILCGWASAVAGLPARLGSELAREVAAPRPAALSGLAAGDAARLTIAYGLTLEN